ncbi:MAG TPA: DUF1080 domain-containing protein [Planctomycetota bacterium]|nr:DUF1080 domain-containing protein [Planctomycetota bacterium]
MNRVRILSLAAASLAFLLVSFGSLAAQDEVAAKPEALGRYLGAWELFLTGTGDTFRSGALVLEKDGDGVAGELVWRWGSVMRLRASHVSLSDDGELHVSPRGWNAPLRLRRIGDVLEGSHDEGEGKVFHVLGTQRRVTIDASGIWDLRARKDDGELGGRLEIESLGAGRYRARGYHDGGPEVDVDAIVVRGNVLTADARIPTASGGTETRRLEVEIRGDRMVGRLRAGDDGSEDVEVVGERRREWGPPVALLSEKGLDGWQARDPRQKLGWSVESGVLTNAPPDIDIVSKARFDDFRLHLEYKVAPGGNSGVYLRGRYEVQILDDFRPGEARTSPHGNGAVYSRIPQARNVSRPAGEWQTYDITLIDRYLTVVLNGEKIVDNERLDGITGGAIDPWESHPGPLMLQGDHGKVWFRNITVSPALPSPPSREAKGKVETSSAVPLFPEDGEPGGFVVRTWNDVSVPAADGVRWTIEDGVLLGSDPRGTWLVSEREYGDFILEYEWRLDGRGNGGCGLRFPPRGDPAFDGLELQMVDPRYYPEGMKVGADELTGSLYKAVAPLAQVFRPEAWNRYRIECIGSRVRVELNDFAILDVDLDKETKPTTRHDGSPAPALRDRPRRGHIGFQELSRDGGRVRIRNARILVLGES